MALLIPLLSACSSNSMMSLFGDDTKSREIKISDTDSQSQTATTADIDSAACGLFFDGASARTVSNQLHNDTLAEPISLKGDPADDLRHAIALDLAREHAKARRLYLWLTAADPNAVTSINCGNGIILSGTITSLAQKRIKAMDISNPDLARSREIDAVVASAIVAPGPELPDPPMVQRNRDFYKNTVAVDIPPEDSTAARPVMEMDVSSNTARLTSVDRPARHIAAPSVAPQTAPMTAARTPPTIKGDAVTPSASNKTLLSTTRPIESGTLEQADKAAAPQATVIEVPIVDTSNKAPVRERTVEMPTEPTKIAEAPAALSSRETDPKPEPLQTVQKSRSSYYAVQLAAYRSRELAESRWLKFETMADGILRDATHEVQSIAIEGQGLFFRLMTGQYSSQTEAQSACSGLKRAGIDCLIRHIKP